jgi:hypothetical protein
MIKLRKIRREWNAAPIGAIRMAYTLSAGKSKGKRPL